MRIMLDTNIIISAALFPNSKLAQSTLDISDKYKLVISSHVIAELREVMMRKFPNKKEICERFLRTLDFELSLTPMDIDPDVYPQIRDKKDYPVLASAIIADVDFFITGDADFSVLEIERPEIMSIAKFAELYL